MKVSLQKMSFTKALLYIVCFGLLIIWIFPLFWAIMASIKQVGKPVSILSELFVGPFTWSNYMFVIDNAPVMHWLWNSTYIAFITTSFTLILNSLAGFALSQIEFRGKQIVYWTVAAGLMIPTEAKIVPLFQIMVDQDLIGTHRSIIYPSLAIPLGVLIMKQFYDAIPKELIEAARIDGARIFTIWWTIFLPLSRSALAALAIFAFLSSWNNFLWPFIAIQTEKAMTLPIGIPVFSSSYTGELNKPMAANMLASIPVIIAFLIFQKHIIKGIALTGIKG